MIGIELRRRGGAVLLLAGLASGTLAAQGISEFPIATPGSQPSSLASGPDGNLWFTEYGTNKIGRITPAGAITEFTIPYSPAEPPPPRPKGFPFPIPDNYSGPIYIEAGSDGALWFTEPGVNKIGRITTSGAITEFKVPTPSSLPAGLTDGPDGALWFTEVAGNKIGRISTSGIITEFAIPTADALPAYITDGPDGNLWFTEANAGKIGRITPAGVVTEFSVPTVLALPADITEGPDGALWFTEAIGSRVGRITTSGQVTEFALPASLGLPVGLTSSDGALWFVETRGDRIGRITTAGVVTTFPLPVSGSAPIGIEEGPDGNLWFTEAGTGAIGRFKPQAPAAACAPSPTTLCLSSGRFQVRVSWKIPILASSGPGMSAPVTGDTGNFWFFSPNSMEVEVKIVDGRAFNNRFWVFYGSLTNVEYTITVTDMVTGKVKTYFNPYGTLASGADVLAF